MRWLRHPATFALGAIVLLVVAIFFAEYILITEVLDRLASEVPQGAQQHPKEGGNTTAGFSWWRIAELAIAAVVALFTGLLWKVSDEQKEILAKTDEKADAAMEIARASAKAARRSAVAMAEANAIMREQIDAAERGTSGALNLSDSMYADGPPTCTIQNVGASRLVLKNFAYHIRLEGVTIPERLEHLSRPIRFLRTTTLAPGEGDTIQLNELLKLSLTEIDDRGQERFSVRGTVLVSADYTTNGKEWRFTSGWVLVPGNVYGVRGTPITPTKNERLSGERPTTAGYKQ